MINGKIEKGVPLPSHTGLRSTFHADVISYLDKLEVSDSVLVKMEEKYDSGTTDEAYKFETKARVTAKIYGIVTNKEFVLRTNVDGNTVRIWRTK